jgi:hypothetical protein
VAQQELNLLVFKFNHVLLVHIFKRIRCLKFCGNRFPETTRRRTICIITYNFSMPAHRCPHERCRAAWPSLDVDVALVIYQNLTGIEAVVASGVVLRS